MVVSPFLPASRGAPEAGGVGSCGGFCGGTEKISLCDLNHRLAAFQPSFGRALLVNSLDPLSITIFYS
jgi:hypothetical protein